MEATDLQMVSMQSVAALLLEGNLFTRSGRERTAQPRVHTQFVAGSQLFYSLMRRPRHEDKTQAGSLCYISPSRVAVGSVDLPEK
jgi:hypothetical protein